MIGRAAGRPSSQAEPRGAASHPTTRDRHWTAVVRRCAAKMAALLEALSTGWLGLGQAPVAAPRIGESSDSSFVEMTRSLDMAQGRLDAVEAHLAGLAPGTPLAAHHEHDLHEIQLRVAQLAAELLGADHPLVAQLVSCERQREVVAPTERSLGSWPAGARPSPSGRDH